jgi:hypothetical protein
MLPKHNPGIDAHRLSLLKRKGLQFRIFLKNNVTLRVCKRKCMHTLQHFKCLRLRYHHQWRRHAVIARFSLDIPLIKSMITAKHQKRGGSGRMMAATNRSKGTPDL